MEGFLSSGENDKTSSNDHQLQQQALIRRRSSLMGVGGGPPSTSSSSLVALPLPVVPEDEHHHDYDYNYYHYNRSSSNSDATPMPVPMDLPLTLPCSFVSSKSHHHHHQRHHATNNCTTAPLPFTLNDDRHLQDVDAGPSLREGVNNENCTCTGVTTATNEANSCSSAWRSSSGRRAYSASSDQVKSSSKVVEKAAARRKLREPRFCFQTRSEVDVLDDGYKWRKYGQKIVKNCLHPRSYYRCTHNSCRVKKRVERLSEDCRMVITTYEGRHNHSPCDDSSQHHCF